MSQRIRSYTSHSPINIEPNYGQLFESDREVQGGNGGGSLDLVVAGDVAHHDHAPEHAHVLHHGGGEAAPHPVPEDVHTVGCGDVERLVEVLGLVVERPVVVEVSLDPRGLLAVSSVAQDPQTQYSI